MPQQFKLPTKRQEEGTPGYALTHFYQFFNYHQRQRFDEWRKARGKAPYFHDEEYGENLTGKSFLIDVADTDQLDQAFLVGLGAQYVEGVRFPFATQRTSSTIAYDPLFELLQAHFAQYTIWPSSHAFLRTKHAFLLFLADVVQQAKVEAPATAENAPLVVPDETGAVEDELPPISDEDE
ncbi:MAG TPA: hypothetical protein VFA41_17140 [Ktedonobacteraceae bacterium]|nr:hypothetical protein [Ktedonobacteraceae bacterium]